jgi:hypothetical protein
MAILFARPEDKDREAITEAPTSLCSNPVLVRAFDPAMIFRC